MILNEERDSFCRYFDRLSGTIVIMLKRGRLVSCEWVLIAAANEITRTGGPIILGNCSGLEFIVHLLDFLMLRIRTQRPLMCPQRVHDSSAHNPGCSFWTASSGDVTSHVHLRHAKMCFSANESGMFHFAGCPSFFGFAIEKGSAMGGDWVSV